MKERAVVIERDDGPAVSGKLIGIDPTSVVVLTGAGDPVTIPRASVRSLKADTATSPASQPKPQAGAAEAPAGAVKVHIESNRDDVTLHQITGQATYAIGTRTGVAVAYQQVCAAPCDMLVDGTRGDQFFLTAGGPRLGPLFRLRDKDGSGQITLKADVRRAPSPGLWYGGFTAVGVGVGAGVVGVVMATTFASLSDSRDDYSWGWGLLGGGVALVGGGIAMIVIARGDYDVDVPRDAGLRLRGFAFTPPVKIGGETLPASGSLSFQF
jgi:hypothetical protein